MTTTHLASDVDSHGVWELEGMEEGVGDHRGPGVGSRNLHELADHLRSEDTSVLVTQINGSGVLGVGATGLDTHVKLAWNIIQHEMLIRADK